MAAASSSNPLSSISKVEITPFNAHIYPKEADEAIPKNRERALEYLSRIKSLWDKCNHDPSKIVITDYQSFIDGYTGLAEEFMKSGCMAEARSFLNVIKACNYAFNIKQRSTAFAGNTTVDEFQATAGDYNVTISFPEQKHYKYYIHCCAMINDLESEMKMIQIAKDDIDKRIAILRKKGRTPEEIKDNKEKIKLLQKSKDDWRAADNHVKSKLTKQIKYNYNELKKNEGGARMYESEIADLFRLQVSSGFFSPGSLFSESDVYIGNNNNNNNDNDNDIEGIVYSESSNVRVGKSRVHGLGLFSKKDIDSGETIAIFDPLAIGSVDLDACDYCFGPLKPWPKEEKKTEEIDESKKELIRKKLKKRTKQGRRIITKEEESKTEATEEKKEPKKQEKLLIVNGRYVCPHPTENCGLIYCSEQCRNDHKQAHDTLHKNSIKYKFTFGNTKHDIRHSTRSIASRVPLLLVNLCIKYGDIKRVLQNPSIRHMVKQAMFKPSARPASLFEQQYRLVCNIIDHYYLDPSFDFYLFCILLDALNLYQYPIGEPDPINGIRMGVGLFNEASFINHSCRYNADWETFYNEEKKCHQLRLVATDDIDKDEEILVSYSDSIDPYQRNQSLNENGIKCACKLCQVQNGLDFKKQINIIKDALVTEGYKELLKQQKEEQKKEQENMEKADTAPNVTK